MMCGFQTAIADAGFTPPDYIEPGKFYRYAGADKRPSNRSGYCKLFDDCKAGIFGDFSTGFKQTWFDGSSRDLTFQERLKLRDQIRVAEGHRRADLEILRHDAARDARTLWGEGVDVSSHPYITNKQITPYGARQKGNMLMIPMFYQNTLWNLQRIYPDGGKFFLKGARVNGCYHLIGEVSDHLYITEGYATACSLREHTGVPVVVAFNANNLKTVALAIRKKYPSIKITLAADNDTATEGNPGLTKSNAAAAAVDGDVIFPVFDEGQTGTDFNDYFNQGGKL